MPKIVSHIHLTCPTCAAHFERLPSQVKCKKFVYCSRPCYRAGRTQRMLDRTYKSGHITDEKLLNDLRSLAFTLGRYPDGADINVAWSGRQTKYFRRFGTMRKALRAAGIVGDPFFEKPPKSKSDTLRSPIPPTKAQLIAEIQRLASILHHTPTDPEMRAHGHFSITRYWATFGKWTLACEQAGLKPHTNFEGGPHRVPPYDYKQRSGRVVRLVGSYEYRFAKMLDRLKLHWQSHGDYLPLLWHDASGKRHHYMPDFYVPAWDIYIETKGWYQDKDKIKMACVARDNPTITVIVVGRDALAQFERTKRLPLL